MSCSGFVRSSDAQQMIILVFWIPGAGERQCPEPEHYYFFSLTVTEPTPALKLGVDDEMILERSYAL